MASLSLRHIYKIYQGDVTAVKDFNLEIEDKEFIVFVGPSGCGKSTTLRMIAGLEDISKGELYIGDTLVNDVEPKERDIAMVFQNYALYHHMSVYDNMAFALKLRKMPKDEIEKKVTEAAKILDIEHLLKRKPKALSGGQRQRVALGRAIVRNPKVFLMDEPLSNLDAKLRVQMRTEISKLYRKLQTTFIYVTHDQVEAMTMGTRIVVMKDGIIQQVDTPQNIYNYPTNLFVAGFMGSPQMNFIDGVIEKSGNDLFASFNGNKIKFPADKCDALKSYIGKEVTFGIRPQSLSDDKELIANNPHSTIVGDIEVVEHMGAESYVYTKCGNASVTIRIEGTTNLKVGEKAKIYLDANTNGYKSESLVTKSFNEVYIGNRENGVIGSLSLGAAIDTVQKSFTQGGLKSTSDSSDFAINGRGFFVVQKGNEYLYTRDGDFTVGADGTLKTTSGDSVMGRNMNTGIMEPIFVGNNQYTLGANNILNVEGLANYQMVTADFEDYSTLKKVGDNYYTAENPIMDSVVKTHQGYLEGSNVNVTNEMVNMMSTMRNFQSSQSIFKMIDGTLDLAANSIGKV